jgi:hypothetical protein
MLRKVIFALIALTLVFLYTMFWVQTENEITAYAVKAQETRGHETNILFKTTLKLAEILYNSNESVNHAD